MGFLNSIIGNATEVDLSELQKEFSELLAQGEVVVTAFVIFRDKWVFTNKRLIMLNIQGLTGSKREYHSLPYKSISQYSIETAGTLGDDCEMKIWVYGQSEPYVKDFGRNVDVRALQRVLANHIFN